MKINPAIYKAVLVGLLIPVLICCKKENALVIPTLSSSEITNISSISATGGGMITSDGGAPITSRGVCWGTGQIPTTASSKTTDGKGTGSFTSTITGLSPGTNYYIRAYATNSVGTAYGNQVSLITSAVLPEITTSSITAISDSTASSGGNVLSDGGAQITARGVCWSTSPNPSVNDSKTFTGTGIGGFRSDLSELLTLTKYYVRAYATNSVGTAYGDEISFTTTSLLNGIWWFGSETNYELTISGSSAIFSKIYSGVWLQVLNKGLISIGNQKWKNINKTGPNKWTCEALWYWYWVDTGEPYAVEWKTDKVILSLSSDKNSLLYDNGTFIYKRKQAL